MIEMVVCGGFLLILVILFYPRRPLYVRRVTKNMNGQPRWRSEEKY